MSTSVFGDITHMNTSTTGMCVLQTTGEVDIGGHYNSTVEQGQCSVLTVLTLPQTAPEPMSNVGHSRAAIGQSAGHPPCRTPPGLAPDYEQMCGIDRKDQNTCTEVTMPKSKLLHINATV